MERDRRLLDGLLTALKTGRPHRVDALLSLIRSNAPRYDIKAFILGELNSPDGTMDLDQVSNNSSSSRRNSESGHKRRRMTGRIHDVVNPPVQVPARPWTSVTDDDDYVSHLVSLWFTWAHPWWHWVDEKSFLKAMQSGDLANPICTPSLVNMILADACVSLLWFLRVSRLIMTLAAGLYR